jgi:hypothetical protein
MVNRCNRESAISSTIRAYRPLAIGLLLTLPAAATLTSSPQPGHSVKGSISVPATLPGKRRPNRRNNGACLDGGPNRFGADTKQSTSELRPDDGAAPHLLNRKRI